MVQKNQLLTLLIVFIIPVAAPTAASAYTLKTTSNESQIRWAYDAISMRYDPNLEMLLDRESVNGASVMASEAWRGFSRVPDILINNGKPKPAGFSSDNPTNGIYLADPWPYEPEKLAVTVTTYEESTGRLLDADVLVNPKVAFAILSEDEQSDGSGSYDFVSILTHEFGHVLGLGESYDDPMATMCPQIACGETHKRSIEEDDETGILEAYSGEPPEEAVGCGKASVSRGRSQPSLVLITIVATIMLWLLSRTRSVVRRRCYVGILACGSVLCIGTPITENQAPCSEAKREQRITIQEATRLFAGHPEAIERLTKLRAASRKTIVGRVSRLATEEEHGVFWTTVALTSVQGKEIRVRLPGGTINGITQQVGDEPVPEYGRQMLIASRSDGGYEGASFTSSVLLDSWRDRGPVAQYP
jgi:hypothetical protein